MQWWGFCRKGAPNQMVVGVLEHALFFSGLVVICAKSAAVTEENSCHAESEPE